MLFPCQSSAGHDPTNWSAHFLSSHLVFHPVTQRIPAGIVLPFSKRMRIAYVQRVLVPNTMAHLPLPQPELAVKVPQHLHSPATGTRPTSSRVPSSVPRLTQTPTKALRFALDPQSSSLEPSPTQAPHRGVIPSTPGEVSACRDPSRSSYSTRVARRSPQSTHAQTPVLLSRSKQSVARKPHACPFERCSFTSNAELILHDHMAVVLAFSAPRRLTDFFRKYTTGTAR